MLITCHTFPHDFAMVQWFTSWFKFHFFCFFRIFFFRYSFSCSFLSSFSFHHLETWPIFCFLLLISHSVLSSFLRLWNVWISSSLLVLLCHERLSKMHRMSFHPAACCISGSISSLGMNLLDSRPRILLFACNSSFHHIHTDMSWPTLFVNFQFFPIQSSQFLHRALD